MIYVFHNSQAVAKWAGLQLGVKFHPPFEAIGIVNGPRFTGAAVFNDYSGQNIEVTIVGRSTISREFLAIIGRYVFSQLKCARLGVQIRADNKSLYRVIKRLGFSHEGRMKNYYGDGDAIVMGLTKDNIPPWIKTRIGELDEMINEGTNTARTA